MKLSIRTYLDYWFAEPTDILLQIEAAIIPEQQVESAWIDLPPCPHFARVPAPELIGERIWLRAEGRIEIGYKAVVDIRRRVADIAALPAVPHHQLPGETVTYLFGSRFCPSDRFYNFVDAEFPGLEGGARVAAIRDWVKKRIAYTPGISDALTTALDTMVERRGVCRDFAHVMATLVRACGIPARVASVYAPGVDPPDFHAVAEVFLGGEWHLVDATGMAEEAAMAKIGVGRDAADIAFLTAFGEAVMNGQQVEVSSAD